MMFYLKKWLLWLRGLCLNSKLIKIIFYAYKRLKDFFSAYFVELFKFQLWKYRSWTTGELIETTADNSFYTSSINCTTTCNYANLLNSVYEFIVSWSRLMGNWKFVHRKLKICVIMLMVLIVYKALYLK